MATFKVIIVGGGLSGALLANGLLNNDVDVTVYERDVQHSKREGYQIRLGDAAIKALTLCCTEEHLTGILRKLGQSTGVTLTAPTLCNTKFQPVVDLSALPAYSKSSAINRVVLRDLLLEPVDAKGAIKFGKAFQRYEIAFDDAGADQVVVHFADGTSDICDILIAADGSGSKINQQIGANNIVDIKTHWSFVSKGNVPIKRLPELPSRLLKGPIITFSKGISLFYSLYLPASFDEPSRESVDSKIFYDEAQASYYWSLNIPKDLLPYNDISEIKDRRQACLDSIKGWSSEYHKMLEFGTDAPDTNDLQLIQLRASRRIPKTWRNELITQENPGKGHPRVWLMGDAIHAMQPNRGQGGNQAMLDCVDALPELLALSKASNEGSHVSTSRIRQSCETYENKMFDRAFTWVEKSGGTGMPNIDLDALWAKILSVVATLALPIIRFFYVTFFSSSVKKNV